MVDRTLAQQAGAAFHWFADDAGVWTGRTGGDLVGRTKDGNCRHAERRSDVHRAGVVGQKQLAAAGQIDELSKRSPARVIDHTMSVQQLRDLLTNRSLARGAEE